MTIVMFIASLSDITINIIIQYYVMYMNTNHMTIVMFIGSISDISINIIIQYYVMPMNLYSFSTIYYNMI